MLVTLGTRTSPLRHRAVTFQIPGNRFLLLKIYRKLSSKQAWSLSFLSLSFFFDRKKYYDVKMSVYLLTGCEPAFPVLNARYQNGGSKMEGHLRE